MNGRIYDPLLGRFLSADVQVTDPSNLQSFNRYSYVRNNPLSLTDPSGFAESDAEKKAREAREDAARKKAADQVRSDAREQLGFQGYLLNWSNVETQASAAGNAAAKSTSSSAENSQPAATPSKDKLADNDVTSKDGSRIPTVVTQKDDIPTVHTQKDDIPTVKTHEEEASLKPVEGALTGTEIATDAALETGKYALNGKIYKSGFHGNKSVSAASVKEAKAATKGILKGFGHAAVVGEVFINVYELDESGYSNRGFAKSGAGFGMMGLAAIVGGPPGWAIAGGYFIADATGLTDKLVFDRIDNTPRKKE